MEKSQLTGIDIQKIKKDKTSILISHKINDKELYKLFRKIKNIIEISEFAIIYGIGKHINDAFEFTLSFIKDNPQCEIISISSDSIVKEENSKIHYTNIAIIKILSNKEK